MSWFTGSSPTAAELLRGIQFHPGREVSIAQRPTWGDTVQHAAQIISPAIKSYLDNKHLDEIGEAVRQMNAQSDAGQQPVNTLTGQNYIKAQQLFQAMQDQKQADTPDTAMDDLDYNLKAARLAQLQQPQADGSSQAPVIDAQSGLMWNGKQWVKPPAQSNAWSSAIPVARGKLDSQGAFTNAYPEAAQGDQVKLQMPNGKSVVVPWDAYQSHAVKPQSPAQAAFAGAVGANDQQAALPQDDANSTPPQDNPLDAATAAQILQQAGGDKDKARKIATQLGYTF